MFSALATSPAAWLTAGILGKIVFGFLTWACTKLANLEVLILNVAATDIQVIIQKGDFDASFDDALKAIQASKGGLTKAQKDAIDAPVRAAFRKFAVFGQLRSNSDSGTSPGDNTTGFG